MGDPIEDREMDDEVEPEKEYDKEEVKSAKEVIQHLVKTTKTLKIYLSNNPIHQKFISELLERLNRHLTTFGALRLRVRQFELHCSGQPVYENIHRMESLSFRFFIDGIREISFQPGIEKEEIITFLEVIGREGGVDDDTVTLLWEKHLAHIRYIVVDEFQGEVRNIEECKEMQVAPLPLERLQEIYKQEVNLSDAGILPAPQGIEIPSLHIFKLTDDEIKKIKKEAQGEEDLNMVGELEGILFDVLRIEREPSLFAEILGILDNILENLMWKGDFHHARKILEFFWERADPVKNLPKPLLAQIENAIVQAGNSKRILGLEPVLNVCEANHLAEFFSLMILVGKGAVAPTVELLGAVNKMNARRTLCDVLVEIGGMDIDALIAKLEDDRWYLVRNLIYVLGKIGNARVIESFSRFVQHRELKVRKEVLHALDIMDDPRAWKLLAQFLADPDLSNRIFAIKSLAKKKVKEALAPLLEGLSSKEFAAKELYEKKEMFEAIGRIGGEEVVPQIRKFLRSRWRLFKNVKSEEMGLCAVVALQRIGSPAAIEALRGGKGSWNKTVREACNKALDVLGTGQP